jgi:NodT family efflux transporter outer membrane factor (OMF) lipoprotein
LSLAVALSFGCQAHNVDVEPEPLIPGNAAYSISSLETATDASAWWLAFEDPKLDALIQKALSGNLAVRQAMARLDQAAALVTQANAARLPQVNLEAETTRRWIEGGEDFRFSQIGGALAWEIDAFNRLGATVLARQREQEARLADLEAVRLGLTAAVADAYFDAVAQRTQLNLLQEQIAIDRNLLELTELRFQAGLTASVDVLQQSSQLAEAESLIPPTEAALRLSENRLDVLTGMAPDAVDRVTDDDAFVDIDDLPFLGVPSDLLLNRPDLRSLKNDLIAADAQIGRAIAERLPRIILDGSLFYEDSPLLSGPGTTVMGSLVQPLLDWGARKAAVTRNEAVYVARLAAFSQAYLEAIEDVENALYQERKQREFLERLERRRQFLSRTVQETTDRYTNGLTDFLPVLDATKELQRVERVIVIQNKDLIGFRIRLHRALGGPV